MSITIGLVDDHQLFLKSLVLLIKSFGNYEVVIEAANGKSFCEKLRQAKMLPDIALVDVNMPVMNGVETAAWIQENFPTVKIVALSMNDADKSIISMIKAGSCAYLLKDTHPDEFEKALLEIHKKGFYNADACNINYRRLLIGERENALSLSEREQAFLKLACSELTYKQVADEMHLSERTIDGYRESLFRKFNVQSRVGLCLEAIRREMVKIM